MKKLLITLTLALLFVPIYSQESENYPLRLFETGILVDNQTVNTPYKGMVEFQIHHRFGVVNNMLDDLFGLWAPGNIRLGLNYAITDRLEIGAGTGKSFKATDLSVKYALLQQNSSGTMPVSLTIYANIGANLLNKNTFGLEHDWREIHRLSYMTQAIVGHQFGEKLSVQVAPTFIWFNGVEEGYKNANYAISAGLEYNLFGAHSLIAEYDQVLNRQENENFNPKPQIALGWQIGTATHAFQIFFANYQNIVGQYNFLYNQNSFTEGDYLIGLNITVRF